MCLEDVDAFMGPRNGHASASHGCRMDLCNFILQKVVDLTRVPSTSAPKRAQENTSIDRTPLPVFMKCL
jgi:hypothetical protein